MCVCIFPRCRYTLGRFSRQGFVTSRQVGGGGGGGRGRKPWPTTFHLSSSIDQFPPPQSGALFFFLSFPQNCRHRSEKLFNLKYFPESNWNSSEKHRISDVKPASFLAPLIVIIHRQMSLLSTLAFLYRYYSFLCRGAVATFMNVVVIILLYIFNPRGVGRKSPKFRKEWSQSSADIV